MAATPSERLAVDDLSGYVFDPVWEDGELVLSRSAGKDAQVLPVRRWHSRQ